MLQSLISLEDHQIDIVLAAVTEWCSRHEVEVDSPLGRKAITVAVDVISNYRMDLFHQTLRDRLNNVVGDPTQ